MTLKLCDLGIFGDMKGGLKVIRKIVTFYHILENYKRQQAIAEYKSLCYRLLGELLLVQFFDLGEELVEPA